MASGNFSIKSSNQYVAATAKWNAVKNIEGNYSLLGVELRASRTNSGYTTYGTGSGYFVINGKKYTFSITSSQKITQNSNTLLGSVSNIKIPHDSDGNKNLTIEVYASIPGAGLTLGTTSKTVALDTIPRATTPTFSPGSVSLGESVTIKLLRASSNFTHTLKYKFGEQTGTLVTGAGVSHIWQVPLDFARQIPNSESGNCTITCETYNGNVLIGSKSTLLTLEVPDTMLPIITSINVSETTPGVTEKFGQYLKDISKLQIEVDAEGVYGSSIKSYAISVLDIVYNGASIVTNTLTQAGEIVATITIKDSRGKSFTAEENIVVADYAAPMIKHFTVTRASASGALVHDGTCASCNANFIIAPISNRNSRTYLVEYRRTDEDTWHRAISGSLYSFDGTLLSGEILDPNYSYYVRLTVADYFGSITAEAEVGTSKPIWNARRDKKGFSLGKISEKQGFENDFVSWFYKELYLMKEDESFVDVLQELLNLNQSVQKITTQKILWSGAYYMSGSHVITLSEAISTQSNGIVLVFSAYANNEAKNYDFNSFFVSKHMIKNHNGNGHDFFMTSANLDRISNKYLIISDTQIKGVDTNTVTFTNSGITINNMNYVLRYVIGV